MKNRWAPSLAALLAIALASALAACGSGGAGSHASTGNPPAGAVSAHRAAAAACSGKYASLASYAGKPAGDSHFFAEPVIAARLKAFDPGGDFLRKRFAAGGPIRLLHCHLMLSSSTTGKWFNMLDFDLASGILTRATSDPRQHLNEVELIGDPAAAPPTATWSALPEGVRRWVVEANARFPKQPPASLAMPRGVRVYAAPTAASTTASTPNAAQIAAIRRAAGRDLDGCTQDCFDVRLVNLNDDGRPDLLVRYTGIRFCGVANCSGIAVMSTPGGYSTRKVELPSSVGCGVLPTTHHGVHDLSCTLMLGAGSSEGYVLKWNGTEYR